jgi:cytochrome c-type biogenesis protein CcmE
MKRTLIPFLIVTFLFQAAIGNSEESQLSTKSTDEIISVNIAEVVSEPKQYNGRKVTLEGVVKKVKYTKSAKGEDFTVFRLKDSQGNEVGVYYEDEHLPIKKGDTVRITGKFRKEKKYFLYKIKNVIKARTVESVNVIP